MKNYLIVVDMQNDFITGSLGTAEAQSIVPAAIKKILKWDGEIFVTFDTHEQNYNNTSEGKKLPVPHCIDGTEGWKIQKDIFNAIKRKNFLPILKRTFGVYEMPRYFRNDGRGNNLHIELIGLCTDICVISNALILKAYYPEAEIVVDASCCAGTTPEMHQKALDVMKSCQIDIKYGEIIEEIKKESA